jgi:predicted nucleotidyltransferase
MTIMQIMDKQNIVQSIGRFKAEIGKYPVQLIYLHGSTAAGRATPISDIDLAIVAHPGVAPAAYLELELELEIYFCKILKTDRVDARIINLAPLGIKGQILTKGILAFSRDDFFRVEFETETRTRYFDFLPVIQQMTGAFFERLKKEPGHGQPA